MTIFVDPRTFKHEEKNGTLDSVFLRRKPAFFLSVLFPVIEIDDFSFGRVCGVGNVGFVRDSSEKDGEDYVPCSRVCGCFVKLSHGC